MADASDFRIKQVVAVIDSNMAHPFYLWNTKTYLGATYLCLAKGDQSLARLLSGQSAANCRLLGKTTIIESLVCARDKTIDELLNPPAKEDLGLNKKDARKRKASAIDIADLPENIMIMSPAIGDIAPMQLTVLTAKAGAPLWVELSPVNLAYLRKVVVYQIEHHDGRAKRPRHEETAGLQGVTYEAARKAYRARRPNGAQRYFSIKGGGDPKAEAAAWAAGVGDE